MTIKEKLLDFLCDNFIVEIDEIELDSSLVDQGIIDSFGLVEIAAFLKKEYGISTDSNEMNRQNFGSVERIVSYVENRM